MRPIKFRAYVKATSKMCQVYILHSDPNTLDFLGKDAFASIFTEEHFMGRMIEVVGTSEIDLMQFTGFLDKNGKEIFEGDVVCCSVLNKFHSKDEFILQVYYQDGSFNCGGTSLYIAKKEHEKKFEIIGNIHQNPELLEG